MKVDWKAKRVREGTSGIIFSIVIAALILPDAKQSQSPLLYLLLIGGLCVGLPLAMSIGVLTGHLAVRGEHKDGKR